jgi:hypothetical protein
MHLRGPVVVDSFPVDDARWVVDDAGRFESRRHHVFRLFFGGIVDSFGVCRGAAEEVRGVETAGVWHVDPPGRTWAGSIPVSAAAVVMQEEGG